MSELRFFALRQLTDQNGLKKGPQNHPKVTKNTVDFTKPKCEKKTIPTQSMNNPASIVRGKVAETGVSWPLKSILSCRRNCMWDILSPTVLSASQLHWHFPKAEGVLLHQKDIREVKGQRKDYEKCCPCIPVITYFLDQWFKMVLFSL